MLDLVKNSLRRVPFARSLVSWLRASRTEVLRRRREAEVFSDVRAFRAALNEKGDGETVLRTRDGLNLHVRRNVMDARIIEETFVRRPYLTGLSLPENPVVVDIGGYIGDFTVYASRYLNAEKVVVYEPCIENFRVLETNLKENDCSNVVSVNRGVSNEKEVTLHIEHLDHQEIHASNCWYRDGEARVVPCDTLPDIFRIHTLPRIDLLKIDCEGGEYDIFDNVPAEVMEKIGAISMEVHNTDGAWSRLESLHKTLRDSGFQVQGDRKIVIATRPAVDSCRAA